MKKINKDQRLSFRMTQEDYERLERRCADAGLTKSEYLRYLVRTPLATEKNPRSEHAILVDRKAMLVMSRELTKWGYHYNQAVHAMNSINYYVARGTIDRDYIGTKAEESEVELATVNKNAERIVYELGQIQNLVLVENL